MCSGCLCVGPTGCGKTLLLRKLQSRHAVDATSSTVATVGVNLVSVSLDGHREVTIKEVGGSMAPLWTSYYQGVQRLLYVVDASNLCQIAAAGVLLYTLLAEPALQRAKVLLTLSKMDASYRQMRNEALLMLQLARLRKEVPQEITVVETSAITGAGIDDVLSWLRGRLRGDRCT